MLNHKRKEFERMERRQSAPVKKDLAFQAMLTSRLMEQAMGWRPWWRVIVERKREEFARDLEVAIFSVAHQPTNGTLST